MKKTVSRLSAIFLLVVVLSNCSSPSSIGSVDYILKPISEDYGEWVFMQRATATADLTIGASKGFEISHQINTNISFEIVKKLGLDLGYSFTYTTLTISSVEKSINAGETIEFYYRTLERKFEVTSINYDGDKKTNVRSRETGDILIYSDPQYAYILFDHNMNIIEDTRSNPTSQAAYDELGILSTPTPSITSTSASPPTLFETAKIKYNANEGSNAPPSHDALISEDGCVQFTLSTLEPIRNGYTFLGWLLYNITDYDLDNPGKNINIATDEQNIVFEYYAQWSLDATAPTVAFSNLYTFWDTGWGDDEYGIRFSYDCEQVITERGIKCWDKDGLEIAYLDGPVGGITFEGDDKYVFFCIQANFEGEHTGSLVLGETYYWIAYVICNNYRYESLTQSFVFSNDGSRWP